MSSELNIFETPLSGTNLIEANAGTGKTYSITGLFTRMIVERGYNVESILVVTFTKAAVSDLKAKIYKRLTDVRDAMISVMAGAESDGTFEYEYAHRRTDTLENDLKAVKYAIRDFDQCSVFTIHGFCQRMLKESAFSGKIPYDVELTGDSREVIRKPIENFWRKNVYKADMALIPHLAKLSPKELISFYQQVSGSLSVELVRPEADITEAEISAYASELKEAFKTVSDEWINVRAEICALLNPERPDFPLKRTSYKTSAVANTIAMFDKQVSENNYSVDRGDKDLIRLTQSNITKYRAKNCSLEHPFFELFEIWYTRAAEFNELADTFIAGLKYRLCLYMDEVLEKHKLKHNLQSYDDLITRMRDAVCTEGSMMAGTLYNRYSAALIDEFQDTDPYQYDIFSTAFGRQDKPFFMIGDPKQAIYSFRGADIYAYLKAARADGSKYTLTKNFRSDPALVESVNSFFTGENSFLIPEIEYTPSTGKDKDTKLTVNGHTHPPVTIWNAEEVSPQITARAAARHIAELLNISASGNADIDGRRIQPSDIAVLCRSRKQMMMVKDALSACRVPAVMSGSASVFESAEAIEMIILLGAVLTPFSQRAVKTAMALPMFGYTAGEIAEITDTGEWDSITEEFRTYNDLINTRGFAPMFFSMASRRKLFEKTASMENGERKLTNLIHITELAQKFEAEKKAAPADILKWMTEKVSDEASRGDEAELKMDSDENAVTIITIFKSKGLEYNIVYTPFLMFPPGNKPGEKVYPRYHMDGGFYLDITDAQESKDMADIEKKAEDLRIAYVALTRAKSVCFTAWGNGHGSAGTSIARMIKGDYGKYDPSDLELFSLKTGVHTQVMPDTAPQTYKPADYKPEQTNRTFDKEIHGGWRINSFSRLIHSSSAIKDTDQFTAKEKTEAQTPSFDIFSFPKGATAGTCLHECMESIFFDNCSEMTVLPAVMEKLAKYSFDPVFAPAVTENIISIVDKEINGISLSKLKAGAYIHEMEFQISTGSFTSEKLAEIFRKNGETDYAKACGTLSFEAMQGFMNGFADLIFESGGKYYVLDWKSNHLGMDTASYTHERMHTEMLGSHYYMQMYIYTLALHMHLKRLLPGYSYDEYMGGGIYVFMRGVNAEGDEGFYTHRPKAETIMQMEKLVRKKP